MRNFPEILVALSSPKIKDKPEYFPAGIRSKEIVERVEKYLKAFLVWHQIHFPKTHDLEEILDLVETVQAGLAESLRDVIVLTPYGVELRYPGDRPDATPEIARRAVELARQVRDAVASIVR